MARKNHDKDGETKTETKPDTKPDTKPEAKADAAPKPATFRSRHERFVHRACEFTPEPKKKGCTFTTSDPAVIAELRGSTALGVDFEEV